ncbi:MAG: LysE family translocator [Ignavibacteria bacterium]
MSPQLNLILFVLSAFAMGFIAAIPIGATQLEIARRSLRGYYVSAMMIVAGSVLSDSLYGVIAFFGIAPFLQDKGVIALFRIVNTVILIGLGFWALRESKVFSIEDKLAGKILSRRHVSFITGFLLAVTNPLMIFWWLTGARIIMDAGIIKQLGQTDIIIFLAAGSLGIGSYLTVLAFGVYKAKKFISSGGIRKLTSVFGIILFLLAGYFIVQTVKGFVN